MKKGKIKITPTTVTLFFIVVAATEIIAKTEQFYYFLCIILLFLGVFQINGRVRANSALALIAYGFMALASCMWTPHPNAYMGPIVKIVTFIFLFLQLQFTYTEEEYKSIKSAFLIQFILLFALVLVFGDYSDGRLWARRNGETTDPNCLAGWSIIPMCVAIENIFDDTKTNRQKIISSGILAATVFMVMRGASRAGIVVNLIAFALCIAYGLRKSIVKHPLVSLGVVVIIVIGFRIVLSNIPQITLMRFAQKDTIAMGGRSFLWADMFDAMKKYPYKLLFGFGEQASRYFTRERNVAHNIFLDVLFSQGVFAFGLLMFFVIKSVKNILRRDPYMSIAYLSLLVLACTLDAISQRFTVLIFFIAAMRVIPVEYKNETAVI